MRRNGHKFNAKATVVDGIRFASQKEARRYQELRLLEKAGEIYFLKVQPCFDLRVMGPFQRDSELCIGQYRGDFEYKDSKGRSIVEDVKGFKTPLYKWKKRHVEAQYNIQIREI